MLTVGELKITHLRIRLTRLGFGFGFGLGLGFGFGFGALASVIAPTHCSQLVPLSGLLLALPVMTAADKQTQCR